MYKTSIFHHFDPSKQCFVETDSSDYVNLGVLVQIDDNGVLYSVAYFSKKMASTKCNYEIYDKKLLAIIWCFEEWRPELKRTGLSVKVLTDHKNLEYFITTKKLTLRQVKWAKFLSEFNCVISYQSSKKNNKANALTRKLNEQPIDDEDKQHKHSIRMLLPLSYIKSKTVDLQLIKENFLDNDRENSDCPISEKRTGEGDINEETPIKSSEITLSDQIMAFNWKNNLYNKIYAYLEDQTRDKPKVYIKSLKIKDRLLRKVCWLWMAKDDQLRLDLIKKVHN